MTANTYDGLEPRELTNAERDEALLTLRKGAAVTDETRRLMGGASLFLAGDHYDQNRSNMARRAMQNGYIAHVRKAMVDGEAGYVCWWTPREAA